MKISILQFKPIFSDINKNFQHVTDLIEEAVINCPDVIVLPELWSTGFYPQPVKDFADKSGRETLNFLNTLAKKFNINIVGGTVIVEENNKFYNRSFTIDRQGKNIAVYDKSHLFSMSKENNVFSPGNEIPIFDIDSIRAGIAICYDVRFPELIRQIALEGVQILFLPAAWSMKRLTHWQILTRARAIENQIFVIAANSAGHSAIIDPYGSILAEADIDEKIITTTINLDVYNEIRDTMDILADCCECKINFCS